MKVAARAYVSTLRFNTSSCREAVAETKRVTTGQIDANNVT
jgi:hypothetical protein